MTYYLTLGTDGVAAAPEGKTLEFKRDLSSPDGPLRTIVAFANSAGGRAAGHWGRGRRHGGGRR